MWVKICGNTNAEDALLAAELGADAIGFVFAPSKRQVTPAQVAQITAKLPDSVERVGVFPSGSAQEIADAVHQAGLTTAQLHGGLDLQLIDELQSLFHDDLKIVQVVSWTIDADPRISSAEKVQEQLELLANQSATVARVLIDSKVGGTTGGTGTAFDWKAAQSIFAAQNTRLQLILAGGLNPENVEEAVAQLQPWGVDVSSGVEAEVGRKDPEKLAQFIQRAKSPRQRSQ